VVPCELSYTYSGVLLVFWPENTRSSIYAHWFLILSLQLSTVVAIVRGQLTQNDAIFAVIMAGSPTNLYLYFEPIPLTWRRARDTSQLEVKLLRTISRKNYFALESLAADSTIHRHIPWPYLRKI